ncbi:MAG: trypsin-like peptidase domain-containing protein [Ignavibacteriaceae bacterium]
MKQSKNILLVILTTALLISITYIFTRDDENITFTQDETNNNIEPAFIQDIDKTTDDIARSRRNIITQTVEKVSPAVVGINVIEIQQYRDPLGSFFDDPFFRQFFGDRRSGTREVKELGSGYIISPEGYIVTNDHVAGNASRITVTLTDGISYDAKLIGSDPVSDIALLKIDGENFPYVEPGNSDEIIIGEWAIALGNPFGLF